MIIGYARVSTKEQDNKIQLEALKKANCEVIFEEKETGKKLDRPELNKMIDHLRPGDLILVYRLDRFSRSLYDLLFLLDKLNKKNVNLKSITEPIDTSTPSGQMFMHMIGVFAEYERSMIVKRTIEGLEDARAQGRIGGRKFALSDEQTELVIKMLNEGKRGAEIARIFNVSAATISRIKKRHVESF